MFVLVSQQFVTFLLSSVCLLCSYPATGSLALLFQWNDEQNCYRKMLRQMEELANLIVDLDDFALDPSYLDRPSNINPFQSFFHSKCEIDTTPIPIARPDDYYTNHAT